MIDQKKIQEAVVMILEAIGEDPNREGLIDTPDRVARMYAEIFSGFGKTAEHHLSKTFPVKSDDVVIERDIPFYSMCEHHLMPFYGKVHIAYIPNGRVAGLSKLVRTVDIYTKKPQIQESLTTEIGEAIMKYLHARGVMVIIEAQHLCINMRGVKRPGTRTITAMQAGIFENNKELKDEVHKLMSIN